MVTYNVNLEGKVVLVTGAAGFIGANLVKRLLSDYAEIKIVGVDSITDYYDVRLKYERLEELTSYGNRFVFVKENIANKEAIDNIFENLKPHTSLRNGLRAFAQWYKCFYK